MGKWSKEEEMYILDNFSSKSYLEMSQEIGRSLNAVKLKSRRLGLKRVSKYTYDKSYFKNIDNEHKAYWLGFIYADGYVIYNEIDRNYELGIQLGIKDKTHLKKFNKAINGNIEVTKIHKDDDFGDRYLSSLRIYSKEMVTNLMSNGVFQNKTFTIRLPDKISDNLMRHFIRGYFDGDGSIYKQSKRELIRCKVTSGSKDFIRDLSNFLTNCNISNYIVEVDNYSDIYMSGKEHTKKFLEFIYRDSTISLDRKYNFYKTHEKLLLPR